MNSPAPKNKSEDLTEKLTELKREAEEKRAKQMADKLNLPYLDLRIAPIESEALGLIDEESARKAKLAVIKKQ